MDDLVAKLRAVKVRTPEEVMAESDLRLSEVAVDDGAFRRVDWAKWWAEQEGWRMASMPDFYEGFKEIREIGKYNPKRAREFTMNFLDSAVTFLRSSTEITFDPRSFAGQIAHRVHSDQVYRIQLDAIRVYDRSINEVAQDRSGPLFLQALFDTKDDPEEIIKTLEYVIGRDRTRIRVVTPSAMARLSVMTRCTGFVKRGGAYLISACEKTDTLGTSYGVRSDG